MHAAPRLWRKHGWEAAALREVRDERDRQRICPMGLPALLKGIEESLEGLKGGRDA